MDIRISHTRTSRETIPATGFLGALGVPGTPAGEEEILVEITEVDGPLSLALEDATAAMITLLKRDDYVETDVEAEVVDEDTL